MRSGAFGFFRLAALLGVAFFAAYVYVRLTTPSPGLSPSDGAPAAQVSERAQPVPSKSAARIEPAPSAPSPESSPMPQAAATQTEAAAAATAPAYTGALPGQTRAADPARAAVVAGEIVSPPPGTDPALAIDREKLRLLMDRGMTGLSAKTDVERVKGMRLIGIAAALGSAPARSLAVRDFPRSAVVRAVVPPADVIREALDPFTGEPAAGSDPAPFAALATYFASRKALATLAAYLVDAVRDDRRLQSSDRLTPVFDILAGVPGACVAMARIIAAPHAETGPECPAEFREQVLSFARRAGVTGRDAAARHIALTLLQRLDPAQAVPRVAGSGAPRQKPVRPPPRKERAPSN